MMPYYFASIINKDGLGYSVSCREGKEVLTEAPTMFQQRLWLPSGHFNQHIVHKY
jgi:hypothetical protein